MAGHSTRPLPPTPLQAGSPERCPPSMPWEGEGPCSRCGCPPAPPPSKPQQPLAQQGSREQPSTGGLAAASRSRRGLFGGVWGGRLACNPWSCPHGAGLHTKATSRGRGHPSLMLCSLGWRTQDSPCCTSLPPTEARRLGAVGGEQRQGAGREGGQGCGRLREVLWQVQHLDGEAGLHREG